MEEGKEMEKGNNMPNEYVNDKCCVERREGLERLIDAKLEHQKELFETKTSAEEKALKLLAESNKQHFEALNHVAQREKERDALYTTKVEHDFVIREINELKQNKADIVAFNNQVKEIESLRLSRASLEGKASQSSVTVVTILAVVGLLISLAGLVMNIVMSFH